MQEKKKNEGMGQRKKTVGEGGQWISRDRVVRKSEHTSKSTTYKCVRGLAEYAYRGIDDHTGDRLQKQPR